MTGDQLLARLRALVRLRPLVYALGAALGALAVVTLQHAFFYAMCVVLLSPAVAALVARTARPRRARLTLEGRIVLFFGVGFLAAALNTGTNLLYFLFAGLAALLIVSLGASSFTFRRLYVRRRAPARARALERFDVDLTLRNEGLLPRFAVTVEEARPALLDPALAARAFVPVVPGRRTARSAWSAAFTRRGDHTLDGIALETRFPFGLVARRVEIAAPQAVLVLPATFRLKAELVATAAAAEGVARRLLMTEERRDVVRSLRDYRSGDHPRAIHWRASAHRGALVVKDFERTEPRRVLVVLDVWANPEVLEDAVSLAASLVASLRGRELKTGLAMRSPAPEVFAPERSTSVARLHAALARLVPPPDSSLAELAQEARRAAEGARVVLVTTRPEPAAREALGGLEAHAVLALEKPGDVARYREGG